MMYLKMKKILVVEDDTTIRANIYEILDASGYNCILAGDGVEALEIARKNLPDLVISDIMMPEMDGYEFFRNFNDQYSDYGVPFIFLSAKTEQDEIRKGMNLGVDDYLTKPFKINDLINAMEVRFIKSEKQKKQLEKFTSEIVLQHIPHELRTPLVAILGISEIIRDDYQQLSENDITQFAEKIYKSGERLQERIEKFLSLIELDQVQSRNILNSFVNSTELIKIQEIILNFISKSGRIIELPFLPAQRIKINYHFLNILLKELLENADKFSPKESEIKIIFSFTENLLQLNIINSSDEKIISINDYQVIDFFQIDKETKQQPGNGLGLSIVKRISKLYKLDFKISKNENNEVVSTMIFPLTN